jgi:hypothetical protein
MHSVIHQHQAGTTSDIELQTLTMHSAIHQHQAGKTSDIDMVLVRPEDVAAARAQTMAALPNKNKSRKTIEKVMKKVLYPKQNGFTKIFPILTAKVPIVQFVERTSQLECDLCYGNVLAIENSKLIREYCRFDPRVTTLAWTVKNWAVEHNLNDNKSGTFSSYALTIMTIHFCQEQGIVPCLQLSNMPEDAPFTYFETAEAYKMHTPGSPDGRDVLTLWHQWLHYFKAVDFRKIVVAIAPPLFTREPRVNWAGNVSGGSLVNGANYPVCVADPFDHGHNLTRGIAKIGHERFRNAVQRSAAMLDARLHAAEGPPPAFVGSGSPPEKCLFDTLKNWSPKPKQQPSVKKAVPLQGSNQTKPKVRAKDGEHVAPIPQRAPLKATVRVVGGEKVAHHQQLQPQPQLVVEVGDAKPYKAANARNAVVKEEKKAERLLRAAQRKVEKEQTRERKAKSGAATPPTTETIVLADTKRLTKKQQSAKTKSEHQPQPAEKKRAKQEAAFEAKIQTATAQGVLLQDLEDAKGTAKGKGVKQLAEQPTMVFDERTGKMFAGTDLSGLTLTKRQKQQIRDGEDVIILTKSKKLKCGSCINQEQPNTAHKKCPYSTCKKCCPGECRFHDEQKVKDAKKEERAAAYFTAVSPEKAKEKASSIAARLSDPKSTQPQHERKSVPISERLRDPPLLGAPIASRLNDPNKPRPKTGAVVGAKKLARCAFWV